MILYSNILNNKRSVPFFSVQILSIFTFSRRKRTSFSHYPIILGYKNHFYPNNNPCWTKEKVLLFPFFEKQKEYTLALLRNSN